MINNETLSKRKITQPLLLIIWGYIIELPDHLSMAKISTLVDTLKTHSTILDVSPHRKDQIFQRCVAYLVNFVIIYIHKYIHII